MKYQEWAKLLKLVAHSLVHNNQIIIECSDYAWKRLTGQETVISLVIFHDLTNTHRLHRTIPKEFKVLTRINRKNGVRPLIAILKENDGDLVSHKRVLQSLPPRNSKVHYY